MRSRLAMLMLCISFSLSHAQTVGLLKNEPRSFNGYTLFAPSGYEHTYLIDNCGHIINTWESDFTPGQSVYLLNSGHLLRTARISSSFNAGGSGGRIEQYDWDNTLVWRANYSSSQFHQHHDIAPMPNGNVLLIAWEKKTFEEAVAAGRDPDLVTSSGLWPERVVELEPVGADDFNVVWEWHLWDHLIQDFDSTRSNYGVVADHPELVDINYLGDNGLSADWIHFNSIEYHPELDQILLSSRHLHEIWIIDHSTTTEEAAGHSGGNSGKGGDLLYRWGNPEVYGRGDAQAQTLFGQHAAQWIPADRPDGGSIIIYNNGFGRPEGTFSSVDVINTPLDSSGSYALTPGQAYEPDSANWSFDGQPDNGFFSSRISSAERQPNGNTLICVGTRGNLFEVDTAGHLVWEYQNPVGINGPVTQGETPVLDDIFHVRRYPPQHPAFIGKTLTPGPKVELNPWPDSCMIYGDTTTSVDPVFSHTLEVAPNPFMNQLTLGQLPSGSRMIVYHISGLVVFQAKIKADDITLATGNWPPGLYLVLLMHEDALTSFKLIKQ